MFLTEVMLNAQHSLGQASVSSLYQLHRTLCSGFPDGQRPRLMFRQEGSRVLMQSDVSPCYQAGLDKGLILGARIKPYEPLVGEGQRLRFQLRANPTSKTRGGARQAVNGPDLQMSWLLRKASQHGFALLTTHIVEERVVQTARDSAPPMCHLAVDFHGTLEVTDSAIFLETLKTGIGSAKAFGFGMLCVAR